MCVCTAALIDRLDVINVSTFRWWLADSKRQLPNVGLNGRPGKLEDLRHSSCYWVFSSFATLNKLTWIDATALYTLGSGDPDGGGIEDRLGDAMDVFHTVFSVADLSLLGYPGLDIDLAPVYCMPASLIEHLGRKRSWKALPRHEI
ncbi:terpenoid cyclases/protein prenyltransferase alpha-alpha toroid [Lactarius quietus]|nr:terpenoid cyclases/protein prenyltransferase alpha-alpha toroid [Lactarius quietus]